MSDESSQADCTAALRSLAEGRLKDWRGLARDCSRRHAEAAFGPSEPGPDGVGSVAGLNMPFRRYPARSGTPSGVVVWFEGDRITAVEITEPTLAEPLDRSLGAPEATQNSLLKSGQMQHIWASRGLTAHVRSRDGSVFRIYAYRPMRPEEFHESWISRVEIRRIPIRHER